MTPHALFAVWPYVAVALFAGAIPLRLLLARQRMAAVQRSVPETWEAFRSGALWRMGVGLLILGHLMGVLFPKSILAWNTSPTRVYLLELVALAGGVAALVGWAGLTWRHLGRGTGTPARGLADIAFLSLLGVALWSGLLTAVLYRWGSSWGAMILAPYARSLVRGRPLPELASQLPFLPRLHVTAAFAALAIVPLTRLGPLLALALHRVLQAMTKPIAAASRALEASLGKLNPGRWIWPDED